VEQTNPPQRILLLLGSARGESSTRQFARQVLGQLPYTVIDLLEHVVAPYEYAQDYPAADEFLWIAGQMQSHDIIIFATPVYWYAMSGRLKTFFDRITDLTTTHKSLGRALAGKAVFLLVVGADPELPPGFTVPFKKTSAYLKMRFIRALYYSTRISSGPEVAALANTLQQELTRTASATNS
jgi:putative NADPH-quinone reductase